MPRLARLRLQGDDRKIAPGESEHDLLRNNRSIDGLPTRRTGSTKPQTEINRRYLKSFLFLACSLPARSLFSGVQFRPEEHPRRAVCLVFVTRESDQRRELPEKYAVRDGFATVCAHRQFLVPTPSRSARRVRLRASQPGFQDLYRSNEFQIAMLCRMKSRRPSLPRRRSLRVRSAPRDPARWRNTVRKRTNFSMIAPALK